MQQNVSSMVRLGVIQSLYLRSTFGVGDRTRLRKRTTEETQTLVAIAQKKDELQYKVADRQV